MIYIIRFRLLQWKLVCECEGHLNKDLCDYDVGKFLKFCASVSSAIKWKSYYQPLGLLELY